MRAPRTGAVLLMAAAVACTEAGAIDGAPSGAESPPVETPPDVPGGVPEEARDAGTSSPPRPDDGILNGTETDVDCGGPDPDTPRCALYKTCAKSSDCAGGQCFVGPDGKGRCQLARSCTGAPGTRSCGLESAQEDCCISLPVPGGSFNRQRDPAQPTTVSGFVLDKYEITVGRIRAYFEAVGGNPRAHAPEPGAGQHPKIPNSGWRASFNIRLPGSWQEIHDRLGAAGCAIGGDNTDGGAATWTPTPGPYEDLPITCLDWYTLFAFCIWDGGRLPTDAEWDYATSGGDEHRMFAWGDGPVYPPWTPEYRELVATGLYDPVERVYRYTVGTPFGLTDASGKVIDGPAHISVPGRKTGRGRWGHADLTGNMLEYLLDRAPIPVGPCNDCARVDFDDPPQEQVGYYPPQWYLGAPDPTKEEDFPDGRRSLRGGSWQGVHPLVAYHRYDYRIYATYSAAGGRCAR